MARIGIDYTAAVRQHAGIGRYTRSLAHALAALDRENRYTLMVAGGWGTGGAVGTWPANFRVRRLPVSDRWQHILWQRLRLPLPVQAVTGPIDLFHSPDFVLPPTGRIPAVVTVHDLSFLRTPQHFVPGFRAYLEGAVRRAVRRASVVLADSQSTQRDLSELLGVDPQRVRVIYPGVEPRFARIHDPEALGRVRHRYGLPSSFLLGLGTLQPRKNLEGLFAAYAELVARHGDAPGVEDLHLVLAGDRGWLCSPLIDRIARTPLQPRVHLVGFVDEADLPALYSLAVAFAFPSWYEGFGLPVLEAMACGTPVIAADNSSLPEVVRDAGVLVGAGDTQALVDALFTLAVDAEQRQSLARAGVRRAAQFTWAGAAERVLGIYTELAGPRAPKLPGRRG